MNAADVILHNGKVATMNAKQPEAQALAIAGDRFVAVGSDDDILKLRGPATRVIDLGGRRVIPGLNDSHLHLIRGGLNYNLELRWDGVPSPGRRPADAARSRPGARRRRSGSASSAAGPSSSSPSGGCRRLTEINAAAPDTPVFVLHLYDRALLNGAALRACGYTKDTPEPPGGEIQRDKQGNPTGLLIARPNAMILYATLAKGPKLPPEHQANSTRHFMRELNRLGVTSCIDAGGGFQNYPDDYEVIEDLHRRGEMTVRIAYNLFTQRPKQELDDFAKWVKMTKPGDGSDFYRMNGAGEMLVFSAADFEDFLEPRPDLAASLEQELTQVVRLLAEHRWPFRLHATYDESISRFLDVFEAVNRDVPFDGLRWFFDHAETITETNLERIKALGGGIAIQHRMAYQGEYFVDRYGADAAQHTPPIAKMLRDGHPGRRRHRRHARRQLQPVGLALLDGHGQDRRRHGALPGSEPPRPDGGAAALHARQRLVLRRGGQERARSCRASWRTWRCCRRTTSPFRTRRSSDSNRCSRSSAARSCTVAVNLHSSRRRHCPVLPDWSPVKEYGGYYRAKHLASDAPANACTRPTGLHALLHRILGSMCVVGR